MQLRDLWGRITRHGTQAFVLFGVVTLLTAYATYHPGIAGMRWIRNSLLFLLAMFVASALPSIFRGVFVDVRDWYRRLLWRKGFEAGMRLEDSDSGYFGEPKPPHRFCLSCNESVDAEGNAVHLRQGHAVVWIARWEEGNRNAVGDAEARDAQSRDDEDKWLFTRIVSALERADTDTTDTDVRSDLYATLRCHVQKPHENREQCPVCFGLMKDHLALLARPQKAESPGDQPTHNGDA